MSFSSDTGMAECLVIARKRNPQRTPLTSTLPAHPEPVEGPAARARFTSLRRRPQGFAQAAAISKNIIANASPRTIEDGPYGGTILPSGDEITGEILTAPQTDGSENWGSVRLADYYLAQTAYALTQSQLWLPARHATFDLPIAPLGIVGKLGLVDRDVTGPPPRGPFDRLAANPSATYPALWNHNARNETRIVCEADSELRMREGMDSKAANVWATASRAHINRDFRFNSQPLTAAFTERESIGGRAWPNVNFDDSRYSYAFLVWCNSTLGLLTYWWHSNRQQPGRGILTIRSADSLPVLDFCTLTDEQVAVAETVFNEFRDKELQPAYLADADPNRALLDRRVICDLLGFDDATYRGVRRLAQKWCAEPSVHGGKARPKDATYVE